MLKPPAEREQIRFEITGFCRQLMLSRQIVALCEQEATPRQEEFLHHVLQEEIAARERSRRARLLNRANFPVLKGLEDYEYNCLRLPPALSQADLASCQFIGEKKNLVLYGPVGIGNYVKYLLM